MQNQDFSKGSLHSNLQNVIIKRGIIYKISLVLLMSLLCFLVSIIAGYIGGLTTLNITIGKKTTLEYLVTALVMMTLIITAINQSFIRSLLSTILVFFLSVIIILVWGNIQDISLSIFLERSWVLPIFGSVITLIAFFIFRSLLAMTDVLFITKKGNILKILFVINIFFSSILSVFVLINSEQKTSDSEFKNILLISSEVVNLVKASSIAYNSFLLISSYISNKLRGTPWQHPGLLRNLALMFASWGSTSFYNLDLSRFNFTESNLANTDLRAQKLYRTCFQRATGLERARVDSRYLDLEIPKVQKLLTHACSEDPDFSNLNLRGAYLQGADLRCMKFINTNLIGADLRDADLRGSILANAQVIDVDFTNANLTGVCIQNWNVNSQTLFTNVQCDYIYRKLDEKGEPIDRYPQDRIFEPREFESLYQEVGNIVELVFKEGVNWRAFAFSLQKLELEDESLGLQLKGIEKKGDLWVAKVTHNDNISSQEVEQRLYDSYDELRQLLATKEQQINSLLGIASSQAEALKEFSKRPLGNSFVINGSTITNLTGSGQIEYNEAAEQVRSIVANSDAPVQVANIVQHFLAQLTGNSVATTTATQAELIKQLLLYEAEKDTIFKQLLLLQGQQMIDNLVEGTIASAIKEAIAQLQRS